MKLKLILKNEKEIIAQFGNEELEINETSENWNTEGINKFLINLATKTPNKEKIEIEYDEKLSEENKTYKHIIFMFKEFQNEYNKLINDEEE